MASHNEIKKSESILSTSSVFYFTTPSSAYYAESDVSSNATPTGSTGTNRTRKVKPSTRKKNVEHVER